MDTVRPASADLVSSRGETNMWEQMKVLKIIGAKGKQTLHQKIEK